MKHEQLDKKQNLECKNNSVANNPVCVEEDKLNNFSLQENGATKRDFPATKTLRRGKRGWRGMDGEGGRLREVRSDSVKGRRGRGWWGRERREEGEVSHTVSFDSHPGNRSLGERRDGDFEAGKCKIHPLAQTRCT